MNSPVRVATDRLPPHAGEDIDLRLPAGTLQTLAQLHVQHGDIFRLATRGEAADTYVVAHPELATEVLQTRHLDYRRVMLDGRMPLVLGNGLLTSHGEQWKEQRKLLQRHFHGNALIGLLGHSAPANAQLAGRWVEQARAGGTIELTRAMLEAGRDSNLRALFSIDADAVASAIGEQFFDQLATTPLQDDTRGNLLFLKKVKHVRACINELIDTRRSRTTRDADLLDKYVDTRPRGNGTTMPQRQIVDEVMAILAAGHETVSAALTAAWYLLSRHPSMQDAVRQEVDTVIGSAVPGMTHIPALRYTRNVLKESLRLYPPVWVITRVAEVASHIGSWHVPQGSHVLIVVYLIHRHPDYWQDPHAFDPVRFIADSPEVAWLPYSRGPRHCIGDDLSICEMLVHLAHVVQLLTLSHVEGAPGDFAAGFTLRSQTPIHVRPILRG